MGRITIMDIHNIYTDVHNCIFPSKIAVVHIYNDIFTSHNVFWIFKITLWISGMVFHFG